MQNSPSKIFLVASFDAIHILVEGFNKLLEIQVIEIELKFQVL
jgi:hypothetical protein